MRTITGLLIGALALSFCSGCAGSESTDVSAPKEVKYTKNMSAGRIPNPPIPEDPWSNDRIWSSLIESKSSTSFSAKINATLPSLTFRINGKFRDKDFHPSYVEIVDETDGRVAQKLFAKGKFDNHGHGFGRIDLAFADLVQLLDMNGDGYLDLRLLF